MKNCTRVKILQGHKVYGLCIARGRIDIGHITKNPSETNYIKGTEIQEFVETKQFTYKCLLSSKPTNESISF